MSDNENELLTVANDRVFNVKFLKLIELHRCIYDTRRNHENQDMIDQAWSEISEECKISVPACIQRWQNLRQMFREQSLSKDTKNNDLPDQKFVVPGINRNRFLQRYNTSNVNTTLNASSVENTTINETSRDNSMLDLEDECKDEVDDFDMDYEAEPEPEPGDERDVEFVNSASSLRSHVLDVDADLTDVPETRANRPENYDEKFLLSIAPDMAKMTMEQKRNFKVGMLYLIDNVISGNIK